ncbi:MAG: S-methyl-5'-thioadenosine phosphorylase [Alphaproteobacteria bacterium]
MSEPGNPVVVGVLGGSGIYQIDGLADVEWRDVASPWGTPSDAICFGTLDGVPVRFLPRHGRGHRIPPSEIDYRANVDALKRAGCTIVVSLSAVGSLRAHLPPGSFVLVDQFVDRTFARPKTFFGPGCVGHVTVARPTCRHVGDHVMAAAAAAGVGMLRGGTYLAMEGPQFSTLAESELYRGWNCDVIGMTNMPEAKLIREAEMCYASVAMVTDYDCWHQDHADVTVAQIVAVLHANAAAARNLVRALVPLLSAHRGPCPQGCHTALDHAIVTAPDARDPALVAKLDAVAGRVLGGRRH